MENISILVAFGAGLFSFLSPCVLPLIPVYFASMAGTSVSSTATQSQRLTVFSHSLVFVSGFTIIFTVLGAGAGLMGLAIADHIELIRQVSGVLMILMGVFLLLALKVPWLNFEKRLNTGIGVSGTGYFRSFITGGLFAVGWTPCCGPILGAILGLAVGTGTALNGAYLLMFYSLGLGLPFFILGIAFDALRPRLKQIQRYSVVINIVSAILIIAIGVLILTNSLSLLSFQV